jgi:hypothetical protein
MAATAFKLTDRSIVNTQGDNVGKHRSEKRGFQSVGRGEYQRSMVVSDDELF